MAQCPPKYAPDADVKQEAVNTYFKIIGLIRLGIKLAATARKNSQLRLGTIR